MTASADGEALEDLVEAQEALIATLRRSLAHSRASSGRDRSTMLVHELRTPLTVIRAALDLVDRRVLTATQEQEALGRARRQAERMSGVIDDLAAYERDFTLSLPRAVQEEVAMRALLEDVAALADSHDPTARITIDAPARLVLRTVTSRLQQILNNLVANAVRYSPSPALVEIEAGMHDHGIAVAVRDRGRGLDGIDEEQLFAPFQRGPAGWTRPGSGVGLYLARVLAESLGGQLHLAGRPGGGTEALLILPQGRRGDPPAAADAVPGGCPVGSRDGEG